MRSKMATDWTNLPVVILVDILSYLELSERFIVSSVCKRWRGSVLHPSFWLDVSLKVRISNKKRPSFAKFCLSLVKEVDLQFDASNPYVLDQCVNVFDAVSRNMCIEVLQLSPSSFRVEWPERPQGNSIEL